MHDVNYRIALFMAYHFLVFPAIRLLIQMRSLFDVIVIQ